MSLKITEAALNVIYREWVDQFGDGRDNHDQRFGQFIFNTFATGEDRMPTLFYEERASAAYANAILRIQSNG